MVCDCAEDVAVFVCASAGDDCRAKQSRASREPTIMAVRSFRINEPFNLDEPKEGKHNKHQQPDKHDTIDDTADNTMCNCIGEREIAAACKSVSCDSK